MDGVSNEADMSRLKFLVESEITAKNLEGCDTWEVDRDLDLLFRKGGPRDAAPLVALLERVEALRPRVNWPYREPDGLEDVRRERPQGPRSLAKGFSDQEILDRAEAGWTGMAIGATLGYPLRGYSYERATDLLGLAETGVLTDYLPPQIESNLGAKPREELTPWLKGFITAAPRNEQLDVALCSIEAAARATGAVSAADVGRLWLDVLPYGALSFANAAAYRNLVNGRQPPETASVRNPFREWSGAALRGCVWGMLNPGRPEAAATAAFHDASLSHKGCGVYLAMWLASMTAAAFVASETSQLLTIGVSEIPAASRLAESVRRAVETALDKPRDWAKTAFFAELRAKPENHSTVTAARIALALTLSAGEFAPSVGRAAMLGGATDTASAAVGAVLGVMRGPAGVPPELAGPLDGTILSSVVGCGNVSIDSLAEQTAQCALRHTREQRQPM